MFKKEQRYSFKKNLPSKYLNNQYFNLRYEKNESEGLRVAVVIGKKIDKRATVRNKLKRIFKNAIKENLKEKTVNYGLVFFLKKSLLQLDFEKIKGEIAKALKEIGVI